MATKQQKKRKTPQKSNRKDKLKLKSRAGIKSLRKTRSVSKPGRKSKSKPTKAAPSQKSPSPIELGTAQFINGDALDLLKQQPKGSVNLIVSSPPYNIRKIYERGDNLSLKAYIKWQDKIVESAIRALRTDGSICWQIGNYICDGEVVPLDTIFYAMFAKRGLKLRNRIVWKFNFGHNADQRFSGRYETILWFTKSDKYKFNLDAVRVPQLYPGKRHASSKVGKAGLPSGNPKGKNPSDYWEFSAAKDFRENPVWDIPNVKANHPEKTKHPCQFPIELAERCVLALTEEGDCVLDPFVGTGATVIAAMKHGRRGIGIDKDAGFLKLAEKRVSMLMRGKLPMRPIGKPIHRPSPTEKVAQVPAEWLEAMQSGPLHKRRER